ncbi:hypothetical protein D0469_14290 [Peribacillus saganii]|uniref:Uncharacterized protein n=1 Tax=Peribacillus saganii TaxID=2303992 RepID=A0A372LL93_9BACI|nr:hypothetical protein D0469_14290 [Peribacillus saganii]
MRQPDLIKRLIKSLKIQDLREFWGEGKERKRAETELEKEERNAGMTRVCEKGRFTVIDFQLQESSFYSCMEWGFCARW